MRYDIKAIPTKYAGVIFRSRLEARWAAFFDQIKYQWQYEPFDLEGWAPDFRIVNTRGRSLLVEVKPVSPGSRQRVLMDAFAKCKRHYRGMVEPTLLLGFDLNVDHMGWRLSKNVSGKFEAINFIPIGPDHKVLWRIAGRHAQWGTIDD